MVQPKCGPIKKLNFQPLLTVLLFSTVSANCKLRQLPLGVRIHGPCSYRRQSTCHATCRFGATIHWRRDLGCQSNGEWSQTPRCQSRRSHAYFQVIPCSKLVEQLPGEKHCVRITKKGKATPTVNVCPELLRIYVQLGKCRREPGTECAVSCLEDSFSLMCMAQGVWYPKCRVRNFATCPPMKPATLVDCSREVGKSCKVRCPNGELATKKVMCSSKKEWTRLPKCQFRAMCASQRLKSPLLRFINSSCKKSNSLYCRIGCTKLLFNQKDARCTTHGKWADLPDCNSTFCPPPKFSNGMLKTIGDCSKKDNGQKCFLECVNGGNVTEGGYINCLATQKWSKLPKCTCPAPKLHEDLELKQKCVNVTPGMQCNLNCKSGFKISGKSFIQCEMDLSWSSQPTCKKKCPKPDLLGRNLQSQNNCSEKYPGDFCGPISCSKGGKMTGNNFITCSSSSEWSHFPDCACPRPILTTDLKESGNCSAVPRDKTCSLECSDNTMTMTGRSFIKCLNDTTWEQLPTCKNSFCTTPEINNGMLSMVEDCSKKATGQNCRLKCVKGGNVTGKGYITCLETQKWTSLPECTCPAPILHKGLELMEDCVNVTSGMQCNLNCKSGFKISGKSFIQCEKDLSWSSQPTCKKKCPKPDLSGRNLQSQNNCSEKYPGDSCVPISCSKGGKMTGNNFITCSSSSEWSHFPDCACPRPILTTDLKESGNCSAVPQDKTCSLECSDNTMTMTGRSFIKCLNDTTWEQLPTCKNSFCTTPEINNGMLSMVEDCSKKATGQNCRLKCMKGGNVTGYGYITCLETQQWNSLPECTCPAPKLQENLELKQKCVNVTPGMHCNLNCKSGFKISGKSFIQCDMDLSWSSQPTCKKKCPKPDLSGRNLQSQNNCSEKYPGDSCGPISCSKGGKMTGNNFITCSSSSEWSHFPDCACPRPILTTDLKESGNCSAVPQDKTCSLECSDNTMTMTGRSFIKCLNDTTWEQLPTCKNSFCTTPEINNGMLSMVEDCSKKATGQNCRLKCVKGGNVTGNGYITCLETQKWTSLPECTCPAPILHKGLELMEDCVNVTSGMQCNLNCKSGFKINGKSFIQCEKDLSWSSQPTCKKKCPKPDLLENNLQSQDNCSEKYPGDFCGPLTCINKGELIGNDIVACSSLGVWSHLPICACPIPTLTSDLSVDGNCSSVLPSKICPLKCSDSTSEMTGQNFITCQNNTSWDSLPTCRKGCSDPDFQNSVLEAVECYNKFPGERCQVHCKLGGVIIGETDLIECKVDGYWSTFPECTCANPNLVGTNLLLINDCSSKKPSDTCYLKCASGYVISQPSNIECLNNARWSSLPFCDIQCGTPTLSEGMQLKENCDGKTAGQICLLHCIDGTVLSIKCNSNGLWSNQLTCGKFCPKPDSGNYLIQYVKDCTNTLVGGFCEFNCKNSSRRFSILCQNDGTWTSLPNCLCFTPVLELPLEKLENCENIPVGGTCRIRCVEPYSSIPIDQDYLRCNEDVQWTTPPVCKLKQICPPIEDDYQLGPMLNAGNCVNVHAGVSCEPSCKNGGPILEGTQSIRCTEEGKWKGVPECLCPELSSTNTEIPGGGTCPPTRISADCEPSCPLGMKWEGVASCISVNNNVSWAITGRCSKMWHYCKESNLSPDVYQVVNCWDVSETVRSCQIMCKNNGRKIDGICNEITYKEWIFKENCFPCPNPSRANFEVKSIENCHATSETMRSCQIICNDGWTITTECDMNKSIWVPYPGCVRPCPNLFRFLISNLENTFLRTMTDSEENEPPVYPRMEIPIFCRFGGRPSFNYVRCELNSQKNAAEWLDRPQCTCPIPDIKGITQQSKEECTNLQRGSKCTVDCGPNIMKKTIECDHFAKLQDPLPVCNTNCYTDEMLQNFYALTSIPGVLLIENKDCLQTNVFSCILSCQGGGRIVGTTSLTAKLGCLSETELYVPDCYCKKPTEKRGISRETLERCSETPRYSSCAIQCDGSEMKPTVLEMKCDAYGFWDPEVDVCSMVMSMWNIRSNAFDIQRSAPENKIINPFAFQRSDVESERSNVYNLQWSVPETRRRKALNVKRLFPKSMRNNNFDIQSFEPENRMMNIFDIQKHIPLERSNQRRSNVYDVQRSIPENRRTHTFGNQKIIYESRRDYGNDFQRTFPENRRINTLDIQKLIRQNRRIDVTDFQRSDHENKRINTLGIQKLIPESRRSTAFDFQRSDSENRRINNLSIQKLIPESRRSTAFDFQRSDSENKRINTFGIQKHIPDFQRFDPENRRINNLDIQKLIRESRRSNSFDFQRSDPENRRINALGIQKLIPESRRSTAFDFQRSDSENKRINTLGIQKLIPESRRNNAFDFQRFDPENRRINNLDIQKLIRESRRSNSFDFQRSDPENRRINALDIQKLIPESRRSNSFDFQRSDSENKRINTLGIQKLIPESRRSTAFDFQRSDYENKRINTLGIQKLIPESRRSNAFDFQGFDPENRRINNLDIQKLIRENRRSNSFDFQRSDPENRRINALDIQKLIPESRQSNAFDFQRSDSENRRINILDIQKLIPKSRRSNSFDFQRSDPENRRINAFDIKKPVLDSKIRNIFDNQRSVSRNRFNNKQRFVPKNVRISASDIQSYVQGRRKLQENWWEQDFSRSSSE